jgi:hypothetical protein
MYVGLIILESCWEPTPMVQVSSRTTRNQRGESVRMGFAGNVMHFLAARQADLPPGLRL